MSTREEFGKYLLLKKLAEDPLGETFRAGRLGSHGMEQVVLLRVYNGQGVDTGKLAAALEERKAVHSALKSPNIGSGVDVGRVRGVPYAAYDYISGKALSTLSGQAQREGSPFPTDHALLIADRIGLALTAAFEARHGGSRVQHGLVVPHLVMVSNEGETRLLGFEAGPALAGQVQALPPEIQRYVAPEIRTGGAAGKSSDVFSLGVILFELLSGKPLPVIPGAGYDTVVQQANLASENRPIPPEIANLVQRSLAAPDERIPDPPSWHKALAKVIADGGHKATTFNLAFFMHNLFREDIERESREIEAEKTIDVPARATSVAPEGVDTMRIPQEEVRRAATTGTAVGHAASTDDTSTVLERYDDVGDAGASGSKKGLVLARAGVLVIAAIAAGVYVALLGSDAPDPDPADEVATTPAPAPVPAEPEGPSPEEIQAQIDSMFEEKARAMEENLKSEYDDRIASMQQQLEQAQTTAAERQRRLEEERAAREAEAERLAAEEEAARIAAAQAEPEPAPEPEPVVPAPAPEPEPEPEPAQPQVKRGELVSMGPGVIAPRLLRRATPRFPPLAARLNKEATVEVRLLVDENGNVAEAEIEGRNPGYGFDEEALKAARASTFQPATKFEVPVKMWTSMRFAFKK
jgi:serine/threonine-protein kinase